MSAKVSGDKKNIILIYYAVRIKFSVQYKSIEHVPTPISLPLCFHNDVPGS